MSADLLREAAAKMRERAEYAPDSPWAADVRPDGRSWVDVADEDGHAWGMHGFPRAAEHVASWHPAVALAVAEVLEHAAEVWRDSVECHFPVGPDESCGACNDCDWRWTQDRAISLARAYMGREDA